MRDGLTEKMKGIRAMFDDRRNEVEAWCKDGLTLEEMGGLLGVSYGTVRNHCIRLGLPYTTKRGSRDGTNSGPDHCNWKGGRQVTSGGYIQVKAPPGHPNANSRGMMFEHRLVMEQTLGRYLLPDEVVHHIDQDKSNNDPNNLCLHLSNGEHIHLEHTGRVFSDETRKRMSLSGKGRKMPPRSPEAKAKQSLALTGRKFSQSTIEKIRVAALQRKPQTPEQRKRQGESLKIAHLNNPEWGAKSSQAMRLARKQQTAARKGKTKPPSQ